MKLVYPALTGPMIPVWIAQETKAFGKYGISVDVQYVTSNNAIFALVAKQIDAVNISSAPVLTGDLSGQDMVFVGALLNHATFALYVEPSIKSAADLKGKSIASDRPGTPGDYATGRVLSLLGLSRTDVKVLAVGGSEAALPALLSGQVQGAITSPPESFSAEAKGYKVLQDTFKIPYQNTGLIVLRSRIDELAPVIPGILAAYRDAMVTYNSQPDLGMQIIKQYTKETNADVLKKTYDFYKTSAPFELSLQPTLEGIGAMLEFLSQTVPAAKNAKPEQFVDTRFLSKLPGPAA